MTQGKREDRVDGFNISERNKDMSLCVNGTVNNFV
jgi:hypothetical protein